MILLYLSACTDTRLVLGADSGVVDISPNRQDTDTGDSAADSGDSAEPVDTAPDRPCAALDGWLSTIRLPPEQVYSYDITGCGVIAYSSLVCDDDAIAGGSWAGYDLDAGQPITLYVDAWYRGITDCVAYVEDYDFPEVLTTYSVEISVQ